MAFFALVFTKAINYICVIMVQATKIQLFELLATGNSLYTPYGMLPAYCSKKTAAVLKHRHKSGTLGDDTYDQIAFHFGFSKETIYTKR